MSGTATSESIIHQAFFFCSSNQGFRSSKRYITRLAHEEEAFTANLRDSARRQMSISHTGSSYSPERYDWRLQATSRPRRTTLKSKAEDKQSFAFIKRIKLKPPQPPLSESSPYYSASSQYKSQCAIYTNVAFDNLVEGLAKAGLKPLRAASAGKTKESLVKWTLEYQLQSHTRYPDWKDLEDRSKKIKDTLNELESKTRSLE
ncbi:hypothetical protein GGU10DRAFT_405245 [Lentinula aff. detonsa]|uniref:Uncharacterized protein n=1 Tax=Lentinula aff. detonsa TaxID=2804958 RepID=A0AA38NI77_9AGAR|nr:hypothetical protein GGU10DRAFT_405245 [Lentinula aff. detonsa]